MTKYFAGLWEQYAEEDGGDGFVVRSVHATRRAALRAARRIARESASTTGGPLSWAGGIRRGDGPVEWYDRDGHLLVVGAGPWRWEGEPGDSRRD